MKFLGRTLLAGLAAIVPIVVTLYLIYWLTVTTESVLGNLFRSLLPDAWYWPGMGVAAGVLLVFLTGLLMHAWLIQRLYGWAERFFYRIPLVRSVYGSIRDLFNLFSETHEQALHQTVIVTLGEMRLIGFVTRWNLNDLPSEVDAVDVAVYLPMSYMIGGYMVLVPRTSIEPVEMSVEDALRFSLTAGINRSKP